MDTRFQPGLSFSGERLALGDGDRSRERGGVLVACLVHSDDRQRMLAEIQTGSVVQEDVAGIVGPQAVLDVHVAQHCGLYGHLAVGVEVVTDPIPIVVLGRIVLVCPRQRSPILMKASGSSMLNLLCTPSLSGSTSGAEMFLSRSIRIALVSPSTSTGALLSPFVPTLPPEES